MPIGRAMMKRGKRPAPVSAGFTPWAPDFLGVALAGWWDAERMAANDVSAGSVVGWTDRVGAYRPVQATSGSQPVYNATGLNGRPCVTFDGTDDNLSMESVPFFQGNSAFEVWCLVSQLSPNTDPVTARRAISFGGASGATACRVGRSVQSSVNRANAVVAAVTNTETTIDFTGIHVLRTQVTGSALFVGIDDVAGTSVATTSAIGTARLRLGATDNATADGFWLGSIASILVTQPLSVAQANLMLSFLKSRGGIA